MTGRTTEGDNTPEVKALLERGIKEKCERLLGDVKTKVHVVPGWGRADVHLNELATASNADLVVVGANHRNTADRFWPGSVSRGVIRHSRTNVVCVPGCYVANKAREDADKTRRVLVPIDFPEASEQAVAIAFASAPRDAEECLFHATSARPDSRISDASPKHAAVGRHRAGPVFRRKSRQKVIRQAECLVPIVRDGAGNVATWNRPGTESRNEAND
jgi:hypothetical protein